MEILLIILGVAVIFVFAFVYGATVWGLVFYKFWYWFLLPVFTQLPEITYLQAIGLMCFVSVLKVGLKSENYQKEDQKKWVGVFVVLLLPWATLLLGYIVKIFIY